MRLLRLVVPCILLVLGLSVAPAHAASGDDPGPGGLLGQLVRSVTGATSSATDTPSDTSSPPSESPSSETQGPSTEANPRDVTSAATPIAVDDFYTVEQDSGTTTLNPKITANDTGSTDWAVGFPPSHGTVGGDPNTGGATYTPAPGFTGTDSFTYGLYDVPSGTADSATVTITVTPTDSEFQANDDSYSVAQDSGTTTLTPSPLANDSTGGGTVGGSVTSQPSDGTAAIGAGGEFTYAPDPGFHGTDTFTYRFTNELLIDSNDATVTITVTPLTGVGPDGPGNDDDDHGHGDGDDNGHGDDDDENDDGKLPDTGAPTSDLLALGLSLAFVGSLLLIRPGGLRRVPTRS